MTGKTGEPAGRASQPGQVSRAEIDRIVDGTHYDPHSVLGAHPASGAATRQGAARTVIRALRPLAASVTAVLPDGRRFPLRHVYRGVFAATLPVSQVPD